jgi:thymidylate synthase ThyX
MITAKIVLDSVNSINGSRLTTFELEYPRFIHSEFMTHRVFSRNAASSRAIPIEKMIKRIQDDPAMPEYWGKNQKGMTATKEVGTEEKAAACAIWLDARDSAIGYAQLLAGYGLHKQIANRVLEPWAHINVVMTATELDNFFNLRCDAAAQPEIRVLATRMKNALLVSEPEVIYPGQWHIPYLSKDERADINWLTQGDQTKSNQLWWKDAIKCSVARCARVSYVAHGEENANRNKDIELHDSLLASGHMSPFEHQAVAGYENNFRGNFRGWVQYRKTLPNEAVWQPPTSAS